MRTTSPAAERTGISRKKAMAATITLLFITHVLLLKYGIKI
jgi:hypothetical protein